MLVNNAGVLPSTRQRTGDGFELTFATNVLAPALLTHLLLDPLRRAGDARVINVSSGGMYTARLDADDPQLGGRRPDGPAFYAHTKRADVVLTELWARDPTAAGISFTDAPRLGDTPGPSLPRFHRLTRPLLRDIRQGADTIVWLATSPASGDALRGSSARPPWPKHRVPFTRESADERSRFGPSARSQPGSRPEDRAGDGYVSAARSHSFRSGQTRGRGPSPHRRDAPGASVRSSPR